MTAAKDGARVSVSWSRRDALRAGVSAAAAALLAACGSATTAPSATPGAKPSAAPTAPVGGTSATVAPTAASSSPAAAATPAAAASPAAASPAASAATGATSPSSFIVLPDSGAKLPTDKVTLRWLGSAGERKLYVEALVPAYNKAHPNITIQYDALPFPEIAKILPLGVQNGNAPDLFELPSGFVTGPQAVQQGWVRPLDDIIPNFEKWKAVFPPGSLVEGNNVFKGKTYSFPFESNKKNNALLLYNMDYLTQAGFDPSAKPFTWDEYRAAAKKLTQQGAGKYYGTIIAGQQGTRWSEHIRFLAQMAGAIGGSGNAADINLKTGQYNFSTDQYLGAMNLLLALKSDGSFLPGTVSLNVQQTDSMFAQGAAAMYINGPYTFPQWKIDVPNFKYGVASQPVPNTGAPMPLTYAPGGAHYWVYAKTQQLGIVGDILSYSGSEAGQIALINIIGGSQPSVFPKANAITTIDAPAKRALALFDQQVKLAPSPEVHNPDVSLVYLEMKALTPDFGTTVQGIFTGQLGDPKKALADLQDRADKELDRAIKAAQAKGAKVSRDDFKFANWDPIRDFTDADYAAK